MVSTLIHDFDRIPLADSTRPGDSQAVIALRETPGIWILCPPFRIRALAHFGGYAYVFTICGTSWKNKESATSCDVLVHTFGDLFATAELISLTVR